MKANVLKGPESILGLGSEHVARFESCVANVLAQFNAKITYLVEDGNNDRTLAPLQFDICGVLDDLSLAGYDVDLELGLKNFGELLGIFLDDEVVRYVDEKGAEQLAVTALKCSVCPEYAQAVQLRIGMGVNGEDRHSLRLPTYIYPAVQILKKMSMLYKQNGNVLEASILPNVVVYSAGNMVAKVNGLDENVCRRNVGYYFDVLRRYVDTNLDDDVAVSRFKFLVDHPVIDVDIRNVLMDVSRGIFETMRDVPVIDKVCNTAKRHGSDELMGLYYASSHAIYSLDPVDGLRGKSLIADDITDSETVVMIGGKSEVDYWRVRQLLRNTDNVARAQIIQRYAEIPPYSGALIDNDLHTENLDGMVSADSLRSSIARLRTVFKKDMKLICDSVDDPVTYLKYLFQTSK